MSYYPNDNQYQEQWNQGYDSHQYNEQCANNEEYYYDDSNQNYDYYQNGNNQEYYPEQQYEQHQYDYQDQFNSLFYTVNPPLVVHSDGYDHGDPISATALGKVSDIKLTYVASHTSSEQTRPVKGGWTRKSFRGSRMTVLYESDTVAGGERRSAYSSFGAHPEANPEILNNLHTQLFGDGSLPDTNELNVSSNKPRPTNSYGPPFGPPYLVNRMVLGYNQYTAQRAEEKHCMGVSSILPVADKVCTVSPYGVRLHTRGGVVVSDKNIEGQTCGTLIGSHILSGGITSTHGGRNIHCLDIRRDMKVVSSHSLVSDTGSSKQTCTVADIAINRHRNTAVAGCTDGTIRLLDGERRCVEVAKAKAQRGGVAKVAVYDNLIATTGYSSMGVISPSSPVPYPFPSHVLIYDIRYLGRGGIPHMSTARSGAHFVAFIPRGSVPEMDDGEDPFLLVGSGQTFGGFELITPFQTGIATSFFQPELVQGESMSTVSFEDGELTIGTSYGRLLHYGLTNYKKTTHTNRETSGRLSGSAISFEGDVGSSMYEQNDELKIPPFISSPPEFSVDPNVLLDNHKGLNVFDSYIMSAGPIISEEQMQLPSYFTADKAKTSTLGPMCTKALVAPSKRWLSKKLIAKERDDLGVATTHSTSKDLLVPHTDVTKDKHSQVSTLSNENQTFSNPNKLLYSQLHSEFYDADADPRKDIDSRAEAEEMGEEDTIRNEESGIPHRYKALIRPPFYKINSFNYAEYNDTKMWVGWDYNPSWSNSWANPVLSLLYFIREIRSTALQLQLHRDSVLPRQSGKAPKSIISMVSELGLLFHLIEQLATNCMIHLDGNVKPFVASNFISAFTLLPEATNLSLVDGVGDSDLARKPEALYRFLVQFLDKELVLLEKGNVIDRLQGIDFVSLIEYSGKAEPKISTNRAVTLDLAYDQKWSYTKTDTSIRFSDILRFSLCKETPLRAFNESTRTYETVTQRKIATSLPSLLALSCCCAGTSDTGLHIWQNQHVSNFLPELIEIQIEKDGSISVGELALDPDGNEKWITSNRKLQNSLSTHLTKALSLPSQKLPIKKSYELQAVISFIRGKSRTHDDYHVIHVRAPHDIAKQTLSRQLRKIDDCLKEKEDTSKQDRPLSLVTDISLAAMKSRQKQVHDKLSQVEERVNDPKVPEDGWLLINGLRVTKTSSDDARSFSGTLKEPSIVIFREVNGPQHTSTVEEVLVPVNVVDTVSLSANGHGPLCSSSDDLPGKGDLVAIDCEFVCIQAEKSQLSSSGAKHIISESRNALARLSIIDCRSNQVIIDDYVLPNEHVVDCLTRFSGVRDIDLDADKSPHHLVDTRAAYLKVRLLMERGCIFVGHGLNQDFRILNISVPPNQIIDTAEIYHQLNQRYISLRYLTNYVLGCDMQQEVHDSVEDAKAAYDLYRKALDMKSKGEFDEFVMKLYSEGNRAQWKIV